MSHLFPIATMLHSGVLKYYYAVRDCCLPLWLGLLLRTTPHRLHLIICISKKAQLEDRRFCFNC